MLQLPLGCFADVLWGPWTLGGAESSLSELSAITSEEAVTQGMQHLQGSQALPLLSPSITTASLTQLPEEEEILVIIVLMRKQIPA